MPTTELGTTEEAAEAQADAEQQQQTTDGLSNAEAKQLPWVQEQFAELKALRAEKAERETAAAKASQEAELEKLQKEQRFDDALKLQKQQADTEKLQAEQQMLKMELKYSLATAGFTERGIDLLTNEYTPEAGNIVEYVQTAKDNERNKILLSETGFKNKPASPDPVSMTGSAGAMTPEQAKAMERSDNPEDQKRAREYMEAYYKQHRKFPD